MLSALVLAIIQERSVKFPDLALVLNDGAKEESNLRRIQSFFADFEVEYLAFARMLMSFVPVLRLDLSIDRTNWQFGGVDFNVLTLTVCYKGTGLPVLFEMLDKRGNSDQAERVDLLDKFVRLFGAGRISSLCGDREFVGDRWFKYLTDKGIHFFLRLRKSCRVTLGGVNYRVDELADCLAAQRPRHLCGVDVHGLGGLRLGLKKLPLKAGEPQDYLAVLTNSAAGDALEHYRKRWSIETFFQSVKKRGFDLEQTHLKDPLRLKKLFALLCLAFALCLSEGIHRHESVKEIAAKSNGYKQNSYFRHGLNAIRKILKNANNCLAAFCRMLDRIFKTAAQISRTLNLDG